MDFAGTAAESMILTAVRKVRSVIRQAVFVRTSTVAWIPIVPIIDIAISEVVKGSVRWDVAAMQAVKQMSAVRIMPVFRSVIQMIQRVALRGSTVMNLIDVQTFVRPMPIVVKANSATLSQTNA